MKKNEALKIFVLCGLFCIGAPASAQFLYQVGPDRAMEKIDEKFQNISQVNQLAMVIVEIEEYFSDQPSLPASALQRVYLSALKLKKFDAQGMIQNRLRALKEGDLERPSSVELLPRLELATRSREALGSLSKPGTLEDARLKMIYIAAGRAYKKSAKKDVDSLYVQGLALYAAYGDGRDALEQYLARSPGNHADLYKKAQTTLRELQRKESRSH